MADATNRIVTYDWVAISPTGKREKGTMRSPDQQLVDAALVSRGYTPLSVKPRTGLNMEISFGSGRIKHGALAEFTRQVYAQVRAGVSIVDAIDIISRDQKNQKTKEMLEDIRDRLKEGAPISEAFAVYPDTFDRVYVAQLRQGEESGKIVQAWARLTKSVAKKVKLRNEIKSAMTYPVLVGIMVGLITAGILIFLVPQFEDLYAQVGSELPAPTKLLVAASNLAVSFWWLFVLLIGGVVYFFRSTKDNVEIGTKINKVLYRVPIFGKLFHKVALFRWAEALAGSLAAGINSILAVELAAEASGSRWMKLLVPDVAEALGVGREMTTVLEQHQDLYPNQVVSMIRIGEEVGDVDGMLTSVAEALDSEVEATVESLSSNIEVVLMVLLGGVVGSILIALYLPIFNLAGSIQ